ncbi:hypothetical protein GCM10023189_37860 [Nibrella saemangeumensis]|uniref:Toxin SymE-like domain-containing protein n=1 Tax=Nibrella saemangeumensis TaxID=1084526 RepID=A0ABP8N8W8_9BACT
MKTRTRKIGYQARQNWRQRQTQFSPSLQLAGNWFQQAGFEIGQAVSIEVQAGQIIIRPAA